MFTCVAIAAASAQLLVTAAAAGAWNRCAPLSVGVYCSHTSLICRSSYHQWRRQDLLRGGAKTHGELHGRVHQLIDDLIVL